MTGPQITAICAAFLILVVITAAAQLRWLPPGRFKVALVFVCGVAVIAALRIADIPPGWFEGSMEGFGLAVFLLLSGFVSGGKPEAREFGPPLLVGMALTLLAINGVAFVMGRL